jgi:hypothetical protein
MLLRTMRPQRITIVKLRIIMSKAGTTAVRSMLLQLTNTARRVMSTAVLQIPIRRSRFAGGSVGHLMAGP